MIFLFQFIVKERLASWKRVSLIPFYNDEAKYRALLLPSPFLSCQHFLIHIIFCFLQANVNASVVVNLSADKIPDRPPATLSSSLANSSTLSASSGLEILILSSALIILHHISALCIIINCVHCPCRTFHGLGSKFKLQGAPQGKVHYYRPMNILFKKDLCIPKT